MKICPSCQQTYPDDGPGYCTNDGTPLTSSSDYGAGSSGYRWQAPADKYPQPPPDWQPPQPPQAWGQNPPGQYAPYGYGGPYMPPPSGGGAGIAQGALLTGIGSMTTLVLGYLLMFMGASSWNLGLIQFGAILVLLSLIAGLTALILGIVAVAMSNRNPSISKAKGIVGICLGAIPLLLLLIGLIVRGGTR